MAEGIFRGSIVALVTPMLDDGAVDTAALAELVEWHIAEGTDGIVAVGTTGESATLEVAEHLDVVKRVVAQARGRVPVIAGTGANATSEAIQLTQTAQELGVAACLVVTPYYNKPPQEGLFQHYRAVAAATRVPVLLYNVPGRTGCDLLPETVARLAQLPRIVGVKEARGDVERRRALLTLDLPEGFALISGDDATAAEALLDGFVADISVTANVVPGPMHRMCAAALAGDAALAVELDAPLRGLHDKLFVEPNPIPVKWALHAMGRIRDSLRLPLVPLAESLRPEVRDALVKAGVALR